MFRSEEMVLCHIYLQPEAAYNIIAELGETGNVQFRDNNNSIPTFQRKFVNEVRRCNEMQRWLTYLSSEIDLATIGITQAGIPPSPNTKEIPEIEAEVENIYNELKIMTNNFNVTKETISDMIQYKTALENVDLIFQKETSNMTNIQYPEDGLKEIDKSSKNNLFYFAGVIPQKRVPGFERMVWRVSLGNVIVRRIDISESLHRIKIGGNIRKSIFIMFFKGQELRMRMKKVCSGFNVKLYPCPSIRKDRIKLIEDLNVRIEDMQVILEQTNDHREKLMVRAAKHLNLWIMKIRKVKAIYHTLNLFNVDVTKECFIGECWVPKSEVNDVQIVLTEKSEETRCAVPSFLSPVQTNEDPPTFHRTNKFTYGFQNLIDSYGVATYREINPAFYAIVTFPFLFSVMFGDVAHGFIITMFAIAMIQYESQVGQKRIKNEIGYIFFNGRYIILLMGLFSLYSGLVYNSILGVSMNIFGSKWENVYNSETLSKIKLLQLDPKYATPIPYFFGMDPVWRMSKNEIIFTNSFKMKFSIIIGVAHMIFGLCLSSINHSFFKRKELIILEFIPQLVFLSVFFVYMVAMIIMKWFMYSTLNHEIRFQEACAPSILIMFINMILFKSSDVDEGCSEHMFDLQKFIQYLLVLIGLTTIPVMLLGKPLFALYMQKKLRKKIAKGRFRKIRIASYEHNDFEEMGLPKHYNEPFSEIFLHQAIHTIEYVLGTISHTASYLRLWALALAHEELTVVLWTMVLRKGISMSAMPGVGGIYAFIAFMPFAALTVAILVLMEGLSAFLHTLRLHWVEFMSKFYTGQGYIFQPFSFTKLLKHDINDDPD